MAENKESKEWDKWAVYMNLLVNMFSKKRHHVEEFHPFMESQKKLRGFSSIKDVHKAMPKRGLKTMTSEELEAKQNGRK